jgi:hypothetical protein
LENVEAVLQLDALAPIGLILLVAQEVWLIGEGYPVVEILPGAHIFRLEVGLIVEAAIEGDVVVGILDEMLNTLQMELVQVLPWHGLESLVPIAAAGRFRRDGPS